MEKRNKRLIVNKDMRTFHILISVGSDSIISLQYENEFGSSRQQIFYKRVDLKNFGKN